MRTKGQEVRERGHTINILSQTSKKPKEDESVQYMTLGREFVSLLRHHLIVLSFILLSGNASLLRLTQVKSWKVVQISSVHAFLLHIRYVIPLCRSLNTYCLDYWMKPCFTLVFMRITLICLLYGYHLQHYGLSTFMCYGNLLAVLAVGKCPRN